MYPEESFDEFVSNSNNGFNNFGHSDENLSDALKGMEDRTSFFDNPDPSKKRGKPKYVSHAGFEHMSEPTKYGVEVPDYRDLDHYIEEMRDEIKKIMQYWEEKGPILEELNEKIEKKYANFRSGASRDLDPDIDALEEDYLNGLMEQEEDLKKIEELNKRIAEMLEVRKRWLADIKERTAYVRKKKNELLDQLARAQKELKDLKARQYAGDNSQFVKDRIAELEDIIANIEEQLKNFHRDAGYGKGPKGGDDRTDKVTVTFDFAGGKIGDLTEIDPFVLDKGDNLAAHPEMVSKILEVPVLDEDHEFDTWVVGDEPFDFHTPINENTVVKARYKEKEKKEEHTVTFRDKKGNILTQITVPHEGNIPSIDDSIIPKKPKLKEFKGWHRRVTLDGKITKIPIDLATYKVVNDIDLYPTYKLQKDKVAALAVATAESAIGFTIDAARRTVDPLAAPFVGGTMATVNGVGYFVFDKYMKKNGEPDYAAEMSATGIKKPALHVKNKVKEYLKKHEEAIKLKLGTTSVLSAIGALINSAKGIWDFTHPIPTPTPTPTPTPVQYEDVEVFKGIDPSKKIYVNPEGTIANGRPDMRWFDKTLEFFDSNGQSIIPGKTPISDINGPIKIVEIQDDGSRVVMGIVNDYLTDVVKVAKATAATTMSR